MRFLLDVGVSQKVIPVLHQRGHVASHVLDIGLGTADDDVIADEARAQGAVVITSDKDFGAVVTLSGYDSPSVITLRLDNPNAREQIATLEGLLDALPAGGLDHCLITVERGRYRRRSLLP
jgi:predicted nuclease of predicted toxin-antitoxin system